MTKKEFITQLYAGGKDFVTLPDDLIVFDEDLDLSCSSIQSLGNLEKVGFDLILNDTQIKSLGNLEEVGGYLFLLNTPLAENHTISELEEMYPQFKGKFVL